MVNRLRHWYILPNTKGVRIVCVEASCTQLYEDAAGVENGDKNKEAMENKKKVYACIRDLLWWESSGD